MQGLRLTGALVMCCNIEDAIGINLKGDLYLGYPSCRGGMPVRSNCPSLWLSLVMARSPSYTCMVQHINCEAAFPKVVHVHAALTALHWRKVLSVLSGTVAL